MSLNDYIAQQAASWFGRAQEHGSRLLEEVTEWASTFARNAPERFIASAMSDHACGVQQQDARGRPIACERQARAMCASCFGPVCMMHAFLNSNGQDVCFGCVAQVARVTASPGRPRPSPIPGVPHAPPGAPHSHVHAHGNVPPDASGEGPAGSAGPERRAPGRDEAARPLPTVPGNTLAERWAWTCMTLRVPVDASLEVMVRSYKSAFRACHPDLAAPGEDKSVRNRIAQELNAAIAYARVFHPTDGELVSPEADGDSNPRSGERDEHGGRRQKPNGRTSSDRSSRREARRHSYT